MSRRKGEENNNNDESEECEERLPIDLVLDKLAFQTRSKTCEMDTRERSRVAKWFGKLLILLTLVSFIFVGIILNTIQLVLCLSSKLSNDQRWRRMHKSANGYLVYLIFTQPIFLIYFWPRVDMKVFLADKKLIEEVKTNVLGILIANHTYELDWMVCFLLADQMGNIGSYKCFAKDELKWLPVIGWTFWMSDLIYVKRNWDQDRLDIEKKLDELMSYDQILLGIFAEGTRYTKEKYEEAVEFAQNQNLEPFKYHLFPRRRGFNFTLRQYLRATDSERKIDGKTIRLFNMEIVLPDRPNFKHFLNGSYIKADVYCEEVEISNDIVEEAKASKPGEECPRLTNLLLDIYRRKDEIIEEYHKNGGTFKSLSGSSNGSLYPLKSPYGVAFCWFVFMLFTYGTVTYLALNVFIQSFEFWSFIVITLTSGLLMLRRIERESKPNNIRMLNGNHSTKRQICDPKAA